MEKQSNEEELNGLQLAFKSIQAKIEELEDDRTKTIEDIIVEARKEIVDWIEQRGDLHFEFPFGQITKSEWLAKKKEWGELPK